MRSTDEIRGMLLPIPTVFDGAGEVDEPVMRDLVRYYVGVGIHALFVCGSFGQGPAMRADQRRHVAEIVLQEVGGRIPVVVHVGTVDPYEASELGKHARDNGADAIGLVGPYYYSDRTEEELTLHFQMVDRAVGLPILVYNNPEYQGYRITPQFMKHLVDAVPHIFGAKLAMGTLEEAVGYMDAIPGFAAFALANALKDGMHKGLRGTVSPPLAATPEVGVALVRAIDEGRDVEADALQVIVNDVNDGLIVVWKKFGRGAFGEALRTLPFPINQYPRWPTPVIPEVDQAEIHALLASARAAAKRVLSAAVV